MNSHANYVTESLKLKKDCPKVQMIFVSWSPPKWKYIYSQWMSKEDIVHLLMILNVNTYANVIFERSIRANEGNDCLFSVNEQQTLL